MSLRLDSAQTVIAVLQKTKSVSGQQGVDLLMEVPCLGKVLTEAVELLNRLEHRFTESIGSMNPLSQNPQAPEPLNQNMTWHDMTEVTPKPQHV